jgi:MFS family permease
MPGRRWMILGVLFAARAATGFQFQSVGSSAKMLMEALGVDYAQIGMLLGAYLLPGVIVALPAGLLGQRFQEKTLGLAGLALMVISGAALSVCDDFVAALAARTIGGVGATITILAATKLTTDWFDGREIVLAMSLLQVSWPFGAMLGPSEQVQQTTVERSRLPGSVLLSVTIAGTIWGAMNLACVLFFSYAPLLVVAQGASPTAAASLVGLAIWFTILAIPTGGYVLHRWGRPISAIIACAMIAAAALALFVAGVYPTISCLIFGVAVGPLSGAILSLPAKVLSPRNRSVGFGVFYTCFYVLMAVGPLAAGRLQDVWGSPSAALVAGAALLVAIVPLSVFFVSLSNPHRLAKPNRDAELRAVS